MIGWLRQHRQALAAAAGKLRAQRTSALLGALVIGVALALPAAGYLLLESARVASGRLSLEPRLSLFLRPEAKRAEADAVARALKAERRVSSFRFVPREEALAELRALEGLGDLVALLGRNPLPDAFIVTPRADEESLEALAAELGKLPQVAHVQADAAWARRLAALIAVGRSAVLLLAALLGIGLVAVTFNTIRLQLLTQRAEIELSKLIGATDAFISRPLHYLGLLQGLGGGALALAIVFLGTALLNREVRVLAQLYGSDFRLAYPDAGEALALVLFASFLGWLGALLSVSKHLREIEPS